MMARFYGVYLDNTGISTVLDIVRFLGQPDSIRFSHITLRGPYADPGLTKARIQGINDGYKKDRLVKMIAPTTFFSERQSTVVIAVELGNLQELFYKPNFPTGTPHLTIYDGKSRQFAQSLYDIVSRYIWDASLSVGALQAIESKHRVDGEFLPFFTKFCEYFGALVGDPKQIASMSGVSANRRLELIESVLERCVQTSEPKVLPMDRELISRQSAYA